MKIALYIRNKDLVHDSRYEYLCKTLDSHCCIHYLVDTREQLQSETDFVMVVGGDGTFLSASTIVGDSGIPIVGVNLGRLGFLSENRPENVVQALIENRYQIEHRSLIKVQGDRLPEMIARWPFVFNEVSFHRRGAAMLGVDVRIDGSLLPTYWADGLLVATSSGSTGYSLSVGGPIVMPESKVHIIAPISPHNLNVRPLVVPDSSVIDISFHAREDMVNLSLDNRSADISSSSSLTLSMAQFSLRRVRLEGSDFINALTTKLYWGEDIRNAEKVDYSSFAFGETTLFGGR